MHLHNLAAVFAHLRQAGLELQSQKCFFLLQKEVNYLGHVVSEQGVSPDPSKYSTEHCPKEKTSRHRNLELTGGQRVQRNLPLC